MEMVSELWVQDGRYGMKIGEEVYIHGYIDEIRSNCVIIRNEGGFFGTVEEEIFDVYDFIPKEEHRKIVSDAKDDGLAKGLLLSKKLGEMRGAEE